MSPYNKFDGNFGNYVGAQEQKNEIRISEIWHTKGALHTNSD
jgi:hypothetical protein